MSSLNSLKQAAVGYPAVPVTLQFSMPNFEPVALFNALKQADEPGFLLTGKPKKTEDGYTFIGLTPQETFTYRDHVLTTTLPNGNTNVEETDLKPILEQLLLKIKRHGYQNYHPLLVV